MTGYVFDIDDTLYCREDLLWKASMMYIMYGTTICRLSSVPIRYVPV